MFIAEIALSVAWPVVNNFFSRGHSFEYLAADRNEQEAHMP